MEVIGNLVERPVALVLAVAAVALLVGGIAKLVAGRRGWRAERGGEHR